jgi:uncharacterized metal-binding protein
MSTGTVHVRACGALAWGFLVAAGVVGIVLSGDIDVNRGYNIDWVIRNKIGGGGKWLWNRFWNSYRRSVKHGSALSHAPVLGTLGRLMYIFYQAITVPHVIIYFVFSPSWSLWFVLQWWALLVLGYWKVILALMGADLIHWALDAWTKENKERKTYVSRTRRLTNEE